MGDDTGVFAVVKRRNGKWKNRLPCYPKPIYLKVGKFWEGEFYPADFEERGEDEKPCSFSFWGVKGVSKYLHVFFCLNPFPNILEKCFYVKNKCSILRRKWSVLKRGWKRGRKEEREIWRFRFSFVTLMYWYISINLCANVNVWV